MTKLSEPQNIPTPDYIGHRQRLKERFLCGMGKDMADYELLELLLTYALPRRDVKPIAKELIRNFENLANTISAPVHQLSQVKGVKDNSITLLKLIEVAAQRLSFENFASDDKPVLFNVETLVEYCRSCFGYAEVEELHVIYLNGQLKMIDIELLQKGSTNSVSASPREIVKKAILKNALGIILVHNHPSGSAKPSQNDLIVTKKVDEACKAVNIKLQEHLIICKSGYYSFRDNGIIV